MTKRICIFAVILMLCFGMLIPTHAASPRLVDDADLLSESEETALTEKLDTASMELGFDLVVVTTFDTDGLSSRDYADDYFDYNGYGFGTNYDGALLLIDMQNRVVWLSTSGYGITAFTDAGINYLTDYLAEYLGDGDYETAVSLFADMGKDYVEKARLGTPYDSGNLPKGPFNFFISLIISLVIGLVVALVVILVMLSKLKTVRPRQTASEYQRTGSLDISQSSDRFLYSAVSCQVIERNSGGSSTHTSSSGRSHGGGGSSF